MTGLPITFQIAVDWAADGDFTDTGDDISDRVLSRGGITIQYGRDQARALAPAQAGTSAFEVDNRSSDYNPENSSSPLFGQLGPGRQVRIQAVHNSITYALFYGQLDTYDVVPDPLSSAVQFTALDLLAKLGACQASTTVSQGIRTGEAIEALLDEVDWPASARQIDPGATVMPLWWAEGVDCFTALQEIVASEGPGALFAVAPNGDALFQDRHHRLLSAASLTSQATFRDTGTEPLFSAPVVYDVGWRDVINRVSFDVNERRSTGSRVVVWSSDDQFTIGDGETKTISVEASDPFRAVLPPVAGTDYTLVSGTVSVAISRFSGQSIEISFTASGGPATVADLQLRAFSFPVVRTRKASAEDTTSIDTDGVRQWPDQAPFASVEDASAIATLIVGQRAQRLPVVTFRVANANDTRIVQQLTRDLSDLITIIEPRSSINRDFYIEQIQHDVAEAGKFYSTTFGCEARITQPADVFILDQGQLDVNTLGNFSFDDPGTVFIFDDATQGQFDVGLFGT